MSEPMDYASAGVDIDLEGSAVASLIGALSKSVRAHLNTSGRIRIQLMVGLERRLTK